MLVFRIIGEGEGTLPDSIAADPSQGFEQVLSNALVTTQVVAEIPANAKVPAQVSILVETGTWFVAFGKLGTDVISAANAPIVLDPAGVPGIVLDDPRKGFILAIKPAAAAGILRAQGSWGV